MKLEQFVLDQICQNLSKWLAVVMETPVEQYCRETPAEQYCQETPVEQYCPVK